MMVAWEGGGVDFLGGFCYFFKLNKLHSPLKAQNKMRGKKMRKVLSETTLLRKIPVYHDTIQRICQMNCNLTFSVAFAYELAKNNGSFI